MLVDKTQSYNKKKARILHFCDIRAEGQSEKVTKESQGSQVRVLLLATKEDEKGTTTPNIASIAAASVEPASVAIAYNAEQVGAALRVSEGFHRNDKLFALRLVRVLQTQLWTDFGWAEV